MFQTTRTSFTGGSYGVSINAGYPQLAGWFISWTIHRNQWMITRGTPRSGNLMKPPYISTIQLIGSFAPSEGCYQPSLVEAIQSLVLLFRVSTDWIAKPGSARLNDEDKTRPCQSLVLSLTNKQLKLAELTWPHPNPVFRCKHLSRLSNNFNFHELWFMPISETTTLDPL